MNETKKNLVSFLKRWKLILYLGTIRKYSSAHTICLHLRAELEYECFKFDVLEYLTVGGLIVFEHLPDLGGRFAQHSLRRFVECGYSLVTGGVGHICLGTKA